jgi:uncharacterized protein YjaZ
MLQQHEAALRSLTLTAAARVAAALPVQGVALAILPDARRAIAGYGIGGYTSGPGSVELVVDPAFPGLAGVLPDRVPILVAHELHHTVRWRGPGYGRTLLEALISEGLADRFAVELLGVPPQPWSDAFPRERGELLLALARPELEAPSYDHSRWFFVGDATLPRWAGYTLGYRLVEAYIARNPGSSAAGLVHTPAGAFRPE